MVFSSIVFLCGFMPIVFLLYYFCPSRYRNILLLIASLIFYAWGEPGYIFIMLFSTVFDYCNGRLISMFKRKRKYRSAKYVLILSVAGNLTILGVFKYIDLIIGTINTLRADEISLLNIALPLGISFYTFQTMSYTIDVYKGRVPAQKSIIDFATYVCMFPQLIAGPIVRYGHVAKDLHKRTFTEQNLALGFQRFVMGLGKKVILANQVGDIWKDISQISASDISISLAWLGALCYTFQIYFDFSGYSDMAIGMGQMLGFDFPENFDHPYLSKSITEFWKRWHISLGTWFKEYVYIPLGGNRCGIVRQVINLFIVWCLTGLWHGAAWSFLLWGIYFFVLVYIEKWFMLDFLKKMPKIFSHVYTMFFVIIGWVIFSHEDFRELLSYVKALFGVGVPFINNAALYKWYTSIALLIILIFASTGFPKKVVFKLEAVFAAKYPSVDEDYGEKIHFWLVSVYSFLILIVSLSMIVSGSYNPFLYFRF